MVRPGCRRARTGRRARAADGMRAGPAGGQPTGAGAGCGRMRAGPVSGEPASAAGLQTGAGCGRGAAGQRSLAADGCGRGWRWPGGCRWRQAGSPGPSMCGLCGLAPRGDGCHVHSVRGTCHVHPARGRGRRTFPYLSTERCGLSANAAWGRRRRCAGLLQPAETATTWHIAASRHDRVALPGRLSTAPVGLSCG